jgi:hypothetical protein
MPYPRPEQSGNTSGDLIVYPVNHMRETAAKILAKVSFAQSQHDTAWQQIQSYVSQNFDPKMQNTVLDCLKPYADRLRATYDWQMSFASALFTAVDAITSTEDNVKQSFTPHYPGYEN